MERLNLRQLVTYFNAQLMIETANHFQSMADSERVVDGWIEKQYVKNIVTRGEETSFTWRELQANVTSMVEMEPKEKQFKFTFETEDELFAAERTGYIESYDCVRMRVAKHDSIQDFPVKTKENYLRLLEVLTPDQILKVYPTQHSYDLQDYL